MHSSCQVVYLQPFTINNIPLHKRIPQWLLQLEFRINFFKFLKLGDFHLNNHKDSEDKNSKVNDRDNCFHSNQIYSNPVG